MARAGLGAGWRCLFANDFHPKKKRRATPKTGGPKRSALATSINWPPAICRGAPTSPGLLSPARNLSLAGAGAGLAGRAPPALFWGFHALMAALNAEGRAPAPHRHRECRRRAWTSNGGADFCAESAVLWSGSAMSSGALTIDAAHFLPQSRPASVHHRPPRRTFSIPASLATQAARAKHSPRLRCLRASRGARRRSRGRVALVGVARPTRAPISHWQI